MQAKSLLRDLTLLAAAAAIGWWAHGANTPVQADSSPDRNSSDPALAFEYGGLGPDGQMSLYSAGSRTLYIYPSIARSSSARIPCIYMVHVDRAGAPLDRESCAPGAFSH